METTEQPFDTPSMQNADLVTAFHTVEKLKKRLQAVIIGRDDVIELILIALFSDGHVLLEDYPGSGKTTLARALGEAIIAEANRGNIAPFRRIQFTPDLLPSDITGSSIFEVDSHRFAFRPGPLFAHIVLADEINRTSPKVQSALLEAMAEKQVTVDNHTYPLDELFFVIATQNPMDVSGTYPLPIPQLDRFLFKIRMSYIDRASELSVLDHYPTPSIELGRDLPQVSRDELLHARKVVRQNVVVIEPIREALVDIALALRQDQRVLQGVSTRSLILMLPALQVRATIQGRDHVIPEDVELLSRYVFQHRIVYIPGVQDVDQVIDSCLKPQIEKLARMSLRR